MSYFKEQKQPHTHTHTNDKTETRKAGNQPALTQKFTQRLMMSVHNFITLIFILLKKMPAHELSACVEHLLYEI